MADRASKIRLSDVAHTRVAPRLHRLVVPSSHLGWPHPPCPAEVKIDGTRPEWTIIATCEGGSPDTLASWLVGLGARSVDRTDRSGERTALRGRLSRLPPPLESVLEACRAEHIAWSADGTVALMLRCSDDQVSDVVQGLRGRTTSLPAITARQAELLQYCVARGYYSIPRRAPLRSLARELGISTTSLSLALRRAEAKIILSYEAQLRANGGGNGGKPGPGKAGIGANGGKVGNGGDDSDGSDGVGGGATGRAAVPAPPPIPRSGKTRAPSGSRPSG